MNGTYSDHVEMAHASNAFPILDKTLGIVLAVCLLVGTTGNILSLGYFFSTKRNTLAEKLYTMVCSIDCCTCIIHIPVMILLLENRQPGIIFNHFEVCGIWAVVFDFLQGASMFLVMLISLTRTISITFPFVKLHKRSVIWSFFVFCGFFFGSVTLYLIFSNPHSSAYNGDYAFCYLATTNTWGAIIFSILFSLQAGISTIAVFISFVISAVYLRGSVNAEAQDRNRKATTTITIFTFIFIVCNFPVFVVEVLYIIEKLLGQKSPGYFFSSSTFMALHSWVLAKVGFVVLNATLNPVMYFLRMQNLRNWVRGRNNIPSSTSESCTTLNQRTITSILIHARNSALSTLTPAPYKKNSEVIDQNPTGVEETNFSSEGI